jgi:HSP20 family molecular chaperone IbpA
MANQAGWINQILGPDFWQQFQEGLKQAHPTPGGMGKPPGHMGAGRPVNASTSPGPAGPPVDLYVTPTEVVVTVSLPGMTAPENLSIGFKPPNVIVIEAFLSPRSEMGVILQRERFVGYCVRTILLPAAVASAAVSASYVDGVLELRFLRETPIEGSDGVAVLQVPDASG